MAEASPGGIDTWNFTHVWRIDRCAARARSSRPVNALVPEASRFCPSFSTLGVRGKKHFSDVFFVGDCPWRLSLYPK